MSSCTHGRSYLVKAPMHPELERDPELLRKLMRAHLDGGRQVQHAGRTWQLSNSSQLAEKEPS